MRGWELLPKHGVLATQKDRPSHLGMTNLRVGTDIILRYEFVPEFRKSRKTQREHPINFSPKP